MVSGLGASMSDEMEYRGFVIRAEPAQLQSGGWTLEGCLIEPGKPGLRRVRFFVDGTTKSRKGAVQIVFERGRQLVDSRPGEQGRSS